MWAKASVEPDRRIGKRKTAMALGLNIESGGAGGNFLPIIKYDARAGRIFRIDREDGQSVQTDITRNFKAVFDFENLEVGWIQFVPGAAPDFHLVPIGTPLPDKPSDNHKQGFRLCIKLGSEVGGDCREMAGTAAAFKGGVDALHDAYLAGVQANPGKLPVVVLNDTVAIESGSGAKKSTNYRPVFSIAGWVPRPKDLGPNPRVSAPAPAQPAAKSAPPATGSTRAAPPAPKAAAPADDEDFG